MSEAVLDFFDDETSSLKIAPAFQAEADCILYHGDCLKGLSDVPNDAMNLIITSPPYNIGKVYEDATDLSTYLEALDPIIDELVRVLSLTGSLCWQVGNFVDKGRNFSP